ncbi:Lrp/AsnC family transcriptional regulator [Nocardia sp. KC 131]|uniref:Lrp/AsnC family transcriptional regulator n=1 Tax=Nocardia arseniciresistens TaxID=3392119 RepID=UPI00398E81D9
MTVNRPTQRGVDEVDVMLLDALHANPRISFEKLGLILGISPATAGRRWQRLVETGRAWVSSVPGPYLALVGAVYEVRAQPGHTLDVARGLSVIPEVVSVYATDGRCDLTALVIASDMRALGILLLERLPQVPRIASATSHIGLEWHSGVHWRLGAIDTDQKRSVTDEPDTRPRPAMRMGVFDESDRRLFLALQKDGRARYRDLARELDSSEHLIRRQLETLTKRGMLNFRTDFARTEGGWPAEFVLWLEVPHHKLADVGATIGRWSATRICLSTVGTANLMVMSQVHHVRNLCDILDQIRNDLPRVTVVDQQLILRPLKTWGRVLDVNGHAQGIVPVDPWASTGVDQEPTR